MHRGADRLPGWGANGWGHGDTTNWGARELLGASGACGGDTLGEESSRDGVNGKNLGGAACRGELQLGTAGTGGCGAVPGHPCGKVGTMGCSSRAGQGGRWQGTLGQRRAPAGRALGRRGHLFARGASGFPGTLEHPGRTRAVRRR